MPSLLEICLEEAHLTPEEERYIRCVALPGGEPGLALDREGAVRWMPDGPTHYGLWVSADDQLVLLRGDGAGPITVSRAGRSLEAPTGKPVVLLDQDLLLLNGRQLRVHVHGTTDQVFAPERLSGSTLARMARATAAALALSAALGIGSGAAAQPAATTPPPIEVRAQPPAVRRAPRLVLCDITAMTADSSKQKILVHARCPAQPAVPVGTRGDLLDAAGALVKDGSVVVKQVNATKIVAESQLRKPVKAAKIRFYVD